MPMTPTLRALLLACLAVPLQAAPLPPRSAIFSSVTHSLPAISSSGKWIASTAVSDGKLRLFPIDGGAPTELGLPTRARGQYYRWADGPADALIIAVGKDQRSDIYRFDVDSGVLTRVTEEEDKPVFAYAVPTNNFAFSYVRYARGEQHRTLSPSGTMVAAQASGGDLPGYLADGKRFLDITPGPQQWTISAGTAAATRTTRTLMAQDLRHAGGLVSLSNDGVAWILSSHDSDTLALYSLDTASGASALVAQAPVDIHKVILDPLTMRPDFVDYDADGPRRTLLNPRVGPDLALLAATGNGFPSILSRSPNDRHWVVKYAHRDGTPRMVSFDRDTKRIAPLPAAVYSYVDSDAIRVRPFAFKGADGIGLTGHVALPRAGVCEQRRCPAVLLVHGGPGKRDYADYTADRFWLTSRGIAVIDINFRGSEGFGTAFSKLDARQWAGNIPQDVNAGLDYALAHFPLERARVAAIGSSFAGYLTLQMAATGTPLRCVVADSASTDIVKFAERRFAKYGAQSDLLVRIGDSRNAADKAAMTRMSPSAQIDQLKSIPLLHLQGGRDDITHPDDSAQFSADMLAANPRYTFVGMPQAGHSLLAARGAYYALAEAFLGRCLDVPVEAISADEAASMAGFQIKGDRAFMPPQP